MEEFWKKAIDLLTEAGGKIIVAILIFIVGKLVIKYVLKFFQKAKFMNKLDTTVNSFFMSFIKIALYVILVISIINVLGVPMASIITVLASCGVAVGLALQGALSNLAGGIMMLIFRPFSVGDYISAAGEEGTVKEISIVYTILNTVDNKQITIPNGTLMNANVTNYSREKIRRVDLTFNIGAEHEISKVQEVIQSVIAQNETVLQEPAAPFAAPSEGIPGGLKYVVRVWVPAEKYWDVYFDLLRKIQTALSEQEVRGPMTHVKQH